MKHPLVRALLFLFALATVAPAAENTPPKGFSALFNGKDLAGWYGWGTKNPTELWAMAPAQLADYKRKSIEGGLPVGKAGPEHVNAHWSVAKGELINDGKGLYLTSDKDYGDFELMVDYKALPDGDSGIYLRGIPQVQIWDTTKGDARGLGQDKGSGGLWNNSKGSPGKDPSKKMDRPFGEWNRFHIRMIGERVTIIFNGEKVVDNAVLENFLRTKRLAISPTRRRVRPKKPSQRKNWRTVSCAIRRFRRDRFSSRPTAARSVGAMSSSAKLVLTRPTGTSPAAERTRDLWKR